MPNLDFEGEVTNYGVHSIYSYPARFVPQIPRFFIEQYKPEIICDCFGGSGTTAVEAKVHGCHAIHMDIMPISLMLARVKTHEFSTREFHRGFVEFHEALDNLKIGDIPPDLVRELTWHEDREYFFNVSVQQQIRAVSGAIDHLTCNPIMKDFFRICAAQCLRRCSNADSKGFEWNKSKAPKPNDNYISEVRTYIEQTKQKFTKFYAEYPTFVNGKIPEIIDTKTGWLHGNFDLLVTSPPYGKLNVVNYPEVHRFSHLFFSHEKPPEPTWFIQTMPQLNLYFAKVVPHLKPGGHAVVVVAPSASDDWAEATINIMGNCGLKLHERTERIVDPSRKYAARDITKEWVLDFLKPQI